MYGQKSLGEGEGEVLEQQMTRKRRRKIGTTMETRMEPLRDLGLSATDHLVQLEMLARMKLKVRQFWLSTLRTRLRWR